MRGSKAESEKEFLQEIIAEFNKKWGDAEFVKNDNVIKAVFEDIPNKISIDKEYISATSQADAQNSKIAFDSIAKNKLQDLVFDHTNFYKKLEEDKDFERDILGMMFKVVMDKQGTRV